MPRSTGVTTRSTNADKHPGAVQETGKRKRRTQAEIAHDEAVKQAEKATKEARKKEGIESIAALEDKMAADDAKNDRPQQPRPLRRTSRSYAFIPMVVDVPEQPDSPPSPSDLGSEFRILDDDGDLTEIDEVAATPTPPKKLKVTKVPIRETINAARSTSQATSSAENYGKLDVERTPVPTRVATHSDWKRDKSAVT